MSKSKTTVDAASSPECCYVRWMIRRDMPVVLAIEADSFESPWSEDEFIRCLRQRNCIGMVVENNEEVIGFMLYELHRNDIHLLNFAVDPNFRKRGVGKVMQEKLKSKLSRDRRNRIFLEIRESNVTGQLFFKACGYRAISILREHWCTEEDAYLMEYCLREEHA